MSSYPSSQDSEIDHLPCMFKDGEFKSVGMGHAYPYEHDRSKITALKAKGRVEKAKVQCPESLSYGVMKDDAISNGDVTMLDVNKPIARKRYVSGKRSLMYSGGKH